MSQLTDDKVEIIELTNRYANAMDDDDLDTWLSTWAKNGLWEGGVGRFQGKEELSKLFETLGPRIKGKRHVMTNNVITLFSVTAEQTCYLLVFEAEEEPKLIATAVYKDKLEKIRGAWKFVHRSIKMDPSFKP